MLKYYQPLDLGEFPFNDYRKEKIYTSPLTSLGKDFKDFIFSKGLTLQHILVLWRPAGGSVLVHSDGEKYNPGWARLNYIYGGSGTVSWWEPNDSNYFPNTNGEYPAKAWPADSIHKVEQSDLQGFNIVNIGSPHSVDNIKTDRWAVSLQLDYQNGNKTSFDDLYNIFSEYAR
jgi:hypothetical protein